MVGNREVGPSAELCPVCVSPAYFGYLVSIL
jgi:hypothetical protein